MMHATGDPSPFSTTAVNQAEESENRIHTDDVARRYGFRGGLVPGVTIFAYLVHPALTAWGEAWLEGGRAKVSLREPVYAGDAVHVDLARESASAYIAVAAVNGRREGEGSGVCASGDVSLPRSPPEPPARRRLPFVSRDRERAAPTPDALAELQAEGLGALRVHWDASGPLAMYTAAADEMPPFVRPDAGGLANPAFMLALANWVLAANVALGPWIHVESEVQNFRRVFRGSDLVTEASITNLFSKGGHEFVDLDVAVFEDDSPVMRASHRAIYRLREPVG